MAPLFFSLSTALYERKRHNFMVTLSIIIVNWNTCGYLRRCLKSIRAEVTALTYEVIVVDNASRDNSLSMLATEFSDVKVVANSENRGFASANNQGIALASGKYLLLLNPDTEIRDDALGRMVAYLNSHPEVGAVGPRLTLPDGTIQTGAAGFDPSPSALFNYAFMLHALFPKSLRGIWLTKKHYRLSEEIDVDWVGGACLMMRSSAIKHVGTLNSGFFMYAEDIELCYRIKKAGWHVRCLSDIRVVHYLGGSTKQKGQRFIKQNITGLDFYYRSRFSKPKVALMHVWGTIGFTLRAVMYRFMVWIHKKSKYAERMRIMQKCALSSLHYLILLIAPSKEGMKQ